MYSQTEKPFTWPEAFTEPRWPERGVLPIPFLAFESFGRSTIASPSHWDNRAVINQTVAPAECSRPEVLAQDKVLNVESIANQKKRRWWQKARFCESERNDLAQKNARTRPLRHRTPNYERSSSRKSSFGDKLAASVEQEHDHVAAHAQFATARQLSEGAARRWGGKGRNQRSHH